MSEPKNTLSTNSTGPDTRKSSLDISESELNQLSSEVTKLVTEYFTQVSTLPIFPKVSAWETVNRIGADPPVEAEPLEKLLADCRAIMNGSRHNGHPRFFGYVASPSTPAGAFADLITSALNANVTSWRSGPAATEIERIVVRWLGSMIGYDDDSHGLLTSGGSLANLIALLVAHRAKSETDVRRGGLWNSGAPMTVYASDQIHMSIPKAAEILGIGRESVRLVPSDARLQTDVLQLRAHVKSDLRDGFSPFCVVASAGTVNTGAVDPLNEIADVAEEFNLWFHVDGAYGALGSLDVRKRPLFAGINRADSVSLDAHKWLYVPIDAGCLLFRDATTARTAFANDDADYVKVHEQNPDEAFAFWDYGTELSRRFRALKIWLTLRYYGLERITQAISEDNSNAEYLSRCVDNAEDFELLAPVQLSICCFRYLPREFQDRLKVASDLDLQQIDRKLDQINTQIMLTLQRGGQAYLSSATIRGKFALRACITNFRTTRADIDKTLEIIREVAGALDN